MVSRKPVPFEVFRERRGKGGDQAGDTFYVKAKKSSGCPGPSHAFVTGFGGSVGSRVEAKLLCDMLNNAWELFHRGDEILTPKKNDISHKPYSDSDSRSAHRLLDMLHDSL